jgi:HAD-superfamily hydrolase
MGFEDSINGLRALRSAPMFTVALATTNPRDVVSKYADLVIDDFTQTSPGQALELI